MHFEILVEDRSGQEALKILLPKILPPVHTFRIHTYRGVGHLPKDLLTTPDPKKRVLLTQLPKLLRGYGEVFAKYSVGYRAVVVCLCDLDGRCRREFRLELMHLLSLCHPAPEAYFCFAEEEGEAWLLGDREAIGAAYRILRPTVLDNYFQDSTCGTWEVLADAIFPGGAKALKKRPYFEIGATKSEWAIHICPHIDVEANISPSFEYFRNKLRSVAE